MKRHLPFALLMALMVGGFAGPAFAQEEPEIDASKPTNFYPLLGNNLEYNARESGGDLWGYRAEFIYPPSEALLFLAELPLLYNTSTEKFGLGDSRLRAFWLPYKNYDNFFGAFGPSLDLTMPTGSFEDGLGSSAWTASLGVTGALMLADWIQTFPIVSYQYTGQPTTDLIPDEFKSEQHGITIQSITPIVFSEKLFSQITPIWSLSDFKDEKTSRYIQEVLLAYSITPTLQASAFWRGVFADDNHVIRLGLTVFFVG
jgi:hypothetical protein